MTLRDWWDRHGTRALLILLGALAVVLYVSAQVYFARLRRLAPGPPPPAIETMAPPAR